MITYNPSNLRPHLFLSLSTDNTFFHLLNLSRRSARSFAKRDDNTVLPTLTVTCMSVSEAPVFIYLLRPPHPVSSFLGKFSRTARQHCDPCFSHGQLYVACLRVGNPTSIYIPAPEGKTKNFSDISNRW